MSVQCRGCFLTWRMAFTSAEDTSRVGGLFQQGGDLLRGGHHIVGRQGVEGQGCHILPAAVTAAAAELLKHLVQPVCHQPFVEVYKHQFPGRTDFDAASQCRKPRTLRSGGPGCR